MNDLEEDIKELCRAEETFFNHHALGDPNASQGSVRIFWGSKYSNPADFHYEKSRRGCLKILGYWGGFYITTSDRFRR